MFKLLLRILDGSQVVVVTAFLLVVRLLLRFRNWSLGFQMAATERCKDQGDRA